MKKRIVLVLFSMLFSISVYSAQNGFEVTSFRPATDNGRYLSVWDSSILDKGEWFFGTVFDYSYRPLQLTKNEVREAGVLDNVFEQHFYSSFGIIKNRLEVGIDIPIGWRLNYKDPRVVGSVFENETSFGDILLNAKIRLLDINNSGVGLSVLPFISLPTGKSDYFFGSGVVTAGGNLIAEVNPIEKVFVAMNLGLLGKKSYIFRDMNDTSKLIGGLGVAVAATKNLNISTDLLFKTRLSRIFEKEVDTSVELLVGAKYAIANTGFVANGGLGGGLINGAGTPQYRIIFGLGYDLPSSKSTPTATIDKKKEELNINKQSANLVHFAFNSVEIEKGNDTELLDNLAKMLSKDPTKKLVTIEGNADIIGSKTANDKISRHRAEAVAERISKYGVEKSRITIRAYGSENPIADNNTEEGRQANRRVEIKIQD